MWRSGAAVLFPPPPHHRLPLGAGSRCAEALIGQQPGIDLGVESVATLANGQQIVTPAWYRKVEAERRRATRQRRGVGSDVPSAATWRRQRRQKGSHRRRKAVALLAKARQKVKGNGATFTTKKSAHRSSSVRKVHRIHSTSMRIIHNPCAAK